MINPSSYVQLLIGIIIISNLNCAAHKTTSNDTPACIAEFINSYKNEPRWYVGSVDEYEFQGRLVYAFDPSKNLADGATSIKSADCVDMCSVGGFAGPRNSQCNGDNFFEKAVLKRTIWKRK
jgi:hypothetical protein